MCFLGVPIYGRSVNDTVINKFWKEGDHYHHRIKVPAKHYVNDFEFRLGVENSSKFNQSNFKVRQTLVKRT